MHRVDSSKMRLFCLALHLLQSSLVYMNTLLLQRVLEDGHWLERLTDADRGAE